MRSKGRWHTTDDNKGVVLLDDFGNVVMKRVNMFGERGEFPVYYDFADIEERIQYETAFIAEFGQTYAVLPGAAYKKSRMPGVLEPIFPLTEADETILAEMEDIRATDASEFLARQRGDSRTADDR